MQGLILALAAGVAAAAPDSRPLLQVAPTGPIAIQPGETIQFHWAIGDLPRTRAEWQADPSRWGDWAHFQSATTMGREFTVKWAPMILERNWRQPPHPDWGTLDRQRGHYTAPTTIPSKHGFIKILATLHVTPTPPEQESMLALADVILCFPHSEHESCATAKALPESPQAHELFPPSDTHVCDRRAIDATCLEYTTGSVFESVEEIRTHCQELGVAGKQPDFKTYTHCPPGNRVGRCVLKRALTRPDLTIESTHYYTGFDELWDWQTTGFTPTCRETGGWLIRDER